MTTKTVFVIGAGASKEVNLPTGYELKGIISNLLDMRFDWNEQKHGDYLIANALREYVKEPDGRRGDINPFLHEAWHIRDALPQAISIDNFIDTQKGNDALAICGKLAIVRSILLSEKDSLLHFQKDRVDSTINFTSLEDTWFLPYGKVGHLPWQERNNSTEFGVDPNTNKLLELARSIQTFTEGTNPSSSDIISIRENIESAERIVFMGFAFHKLNMELLKPTEISRTDFSNLKCFATTLGISKSDKEVIMEQISNLYGVVVHPNMANVKCKDLFTEFWRSLSF